MFDWPFCICELKRMVVLITKCLFVADNSPRSSGEEAEFCKVGILLKVPYIVVSLSFRNITSVLQ